MSTIRITDGWLRGPLALGRILEEEENPLCGVDMGGSYCMLLLVWLVNIFSNMQIRESSLFEAEGD